MTLAARVQIVEHLRAALPATYTVLEFARPLSDVTKTTVMVETTKIEPGPTGGTFQATCTTWVVARYEDYVQAEAALEDAVVEVLVALDGLTNISLTATRVELGEPDAHHHAYRVELVVPLTKEV